MVFKVNKIALCLFRLKNEHKKGYCRDGGLGLACSLLEVC